VASDLYDTSLCSLLTPPRTSRLGLYFPVRDAEGLRSFFYAILAFDIETPMLLLDYYAASPVV